MGINRFLITVAALVLLLLVGCGAHGVVTPSFAPTVTPSPTGEDDASGLSAEEAATLHSLMQVDDYPLYTMRYVGAYETVSIQDDVEVEVASARLPDSDLTMQQPAWACSLFAALGDAGNRLYGRNFDWEYSPALLLFTDPPDGYASVSMVDIAYLGFGGSLASNLVDLPVGARQALLRAPGLPFDGMNDQGLVVGMAAVPESDKPYDGSKKTADSLMVIREMLDHARSVDEAVAILQSYNVEWGDGPPLHYLVADSSGRSTLVEFYQGKMVTMPNDKPWHLATNFIRSSVDNPEGACWRYDQINQRLAQAGGQLAVQEAVRLLNDVSQDSTQWSIVYGLSTGDLSVAMGRRYDKLHTFHLNLAGK